MIIACSIAPLAAGIYGAVLDSSHRRTEKALAAFIGETVGEDFGEPWVQWVCCEDRSYIVCALPRHTSSDRVAYCLEPIIESPAHGDVHIDGGFYWRLDRESPENATDLPSAIHGCFGSAANRCT